MPESNEKVHFLKPRPRRLDVEPPVGSELETLRHLQMRGALSNQDFARLQELEAKAERTK